MRGLKVRAREGSGNHKVANVGEDNFFALVGIIEDAVKDLPPVTPTEAGVVEPGPTTTPTGP